MANNDDLVTDGLALRNRWVAQMKTAGATECPVCFQRPKLRQHVFTTTMALALIFLYHRGAPTPAAKVPSVVKTGDSLKKLVMWGLVLEEGGGYALAPDGEEVVLKRAMVPRYCIAVGGYAAWFDGERVWIDETLNQRYSYADLMKGEA